MAKYSWINLPPVIGVVETVGVDLVVAEEVHCLPAAKVEAETEAEANVRTASVIFSRQYRPNLVYLIGLLKGIFL